MAVSAKEKIIRALLSEGGMNISELSRATHVSRAVLTRECDLMVDSGILSVGAHRYTVNERILSVSLFVHNGFAEIVSFNASGVIGHERMEYIDSFSLEDNITLAGRYFSEYARYMRGEAHAVLTSALFDGKAIPDIATLKDVNIKARRAEVLATVVEGKYPSSTVLCVDCANLVCVLCRGGEAVCEGAVRSERAFLTSVKGVFSLLTPSIAAVIGEDGENYGNDGAEDAECDIPAFSDRLYSICRDYKIPFVRLDSDIKREMLARALTLIATEKVMRCSFDKRFIE